MSTTHHATCHSSDGFNRDTVASVGIVPHYLPFVKNNTAIRYFRHALALDERRAKFTPLYHFSTAQKCEKLEPDMKPAAGLSALKEATGAFAGGGAEEGYENLSRETAELLKYEKAVNEATGQTTDVLEVWFAGAHTGQ